MTTIFVIVFLAFVAIWLHSIFRKHPAEELVPYYDYYVEFSDSETGHKIIASEACGGVVWSDMVTGEDNYVPTTLDEYAAERGLDIERYVCGYIPRNDPKKKTGDEKV